jgi:glycogen debranching enzyme
LDGQINWPSDKGLYFRDTRLISNWSIYANGEPWMLLNGGAIGILRCADISHEPRIRDGNAGNCLLYGIAPPERAKKVKQRLMASDMWTGWGIRTLSASNPAFNPYNYQTGSVWPHDNAIIALGFKRYGFGAEAAQIAHDIGKAASYFRLNQLPELYTAFQRDETTFPVQYIGANVPQAWAAGAAFMLTQAMLGFMPDAPHNKLYVDPWLPKWLPDLTIQDIRVGHHKRPEYC